MSDLILRPSCYHCPTREFKSGSDITLADLWGVWKTLPDYNDDKGCSCVSINSDKGKGLFEKIEKELTYKEISYKSAFIDYNYSAVYNPSVNPHSEKFYSLYTKEPLSVLVPILTKESTKTQLKNMVTHILDKVGLLKTLRKFT